MEDNVKTRLMQFIKHLGMTTKSFENRCGMSNGYIGAMRKGLGDEKLNNVLSQFPQLDRQWLLFGEGNMLKETQEPKVVIMKPTGNIRYWEDVAATGGSPEFLMNPNEHDVRMIDVPNFGDCTDAVNIYGDSMSPLYKSGEVIILKEWKESWIDYGCVYLIVTLNGNRMVKYLRKADDDNKVKCVSENKEFDDFEIPKSDILRLFIVKGAIRKDSL